MKKGANDSGKSFFNLYKKFIFFAVLAVSLTAVFGGRFLSTQEAATKPPAVAEPAAQFCSANPITIAGSLSSGPASPYPSTINVSGITGVITSVSVTLNNVQHPWSSDIDVLLVGPNGEKFVIMSDVGWAQGFDNPATVTLSDAGATQMTGQNGQIPSGTYKPTNYQQGSVNDFDSFDAPAPIGPYHQPGPQSGGAATFDSVFRNADPNGAWRLYVFDDSSSNTGSIAGGWCLTIETGAPPPNRMQFAAANFNAQAGTTATVTVNRADAAAGAVSVNYATADNTATGGAACAAAGVDYVSTGGVLNFADGEVSKNVGVELCAGDASEPDETFNITLSNPTGGAVIGSPGAATVSIFNGDLPCDTFWTRAASPHQITGIRTIFAEQVVCVEPGAVVSITGSGKINNYGELRALGTATDRIALTGGGRIVSAGTISLDKTDVGIQLDTSSTLTARDTNFGARGSITAFFSLFLSGTVEYITLENVVFDSNQPVQADNAQLYGSFYYLLMKNVAFRNRAFFNASSVMNKFENVRSENSAYEGFSFSSANIQPQLLENLSATNCARAGFDLFSGNYFFGDNITIRNCEYPISGAGGILPGSVVPATGNRNNWIEVGQPGGAVTYAPVGLPYVVSGFANIGTIELLPGITLKARSNFAFNTGGGSALDALGLPNAPIVFEPFDPSQKWIGGQFNTNGDRMEYVVLDGMRQGIASPELSGADYYVDNSLLRNNTVGVKDMFQSNGSAYLQSNLFTNNQYAIVAENARIHAGERTNPNLFENNTVAVESISAPDVRNNWWNSPTGPTTPQNPGGTGDKINGGARFRPFLTARPDTSDHPPVVRLPRTPWQGASEGLLEAGTKVVLHWDAFDDRRIVKQKILFSDAGNARSSFTKIADNLPPGQRSFEFTVPGVGFVQSGAPQFVRVVAIDDRGQEGFEDWQVTIPSGEIYGELTITANVAGRIFRPGDEVPFTYQINSGFPEGSVERFIVFDADRTLRSFGANSIATMPPVSTDTARLAIVYSRSLNQQKIFYSEPFAIRPDPRFPDAAPVVSLAAPVPGQQFNAGDTVPIQWTGVDDEAIRYFNIQTSTDGGRTWIQIAEKIPATTTSYNWQPKIRSAIPDVRVRVIAVDRRFQNSSATRSISFNAPPNQAPAVQVTFPANGAVYSVGQSTFIAAEANDPDGTIQRVEFYAKGGAFLPEGDAHFIGADTTAPFQVPWNYPFAQGYVVTARAYDDKNRLVNSAPVSVTVNPVSPAAPLPIGIPELTNPVDGAQFPAPAAITLEGLPAPTNRTILRVEFYNGTTLVGTDTTAPYSVALNNLPEGKYTFFVKSYADNGADSVSTVTDVTVGGSAEARRTPFDFDGDGKADVGIFRPSVGEWWIRRSGTSETIAYQFGSGADKIVAADFTGDGKTDAAVWRPASGEWFVLRSEDSSFYSVPFGTTGDIPAVADYDGDGRADPAVFRPSSATWYISKSSGGTMIQSFGTDGDQPVPADFDGDGKTDLAIYRPASGEWWIQRSTDLSVYAFQFGTHEDLPVPADFTGDGKTDAAFWRPASGEWFILRSEDSSFYSLPFGMSGDQPVAADYDGDGKADIAVFRQGVWYLQQSAAGTAIFQFGLSSDRPIPVGGAAP